MTCIFGFRASKFIGIVPCHDNIFFESRSGYCYQTLLIEPPIFLRRLELDLRIAGVRMIRTTFNNQDEILTDLDEEILVSCLGLGSGTVMKDSAVVPVKGQLVLLKPQPELQYLYAGDGYIFPRSDSIVVGGTYEYGETDPIPNPKMCAEILAHARASFSNTEIATSVPEWMVEIQEINFYF